MKATRLEFFLAILCVILFGRFCDLGRTYNLEMPKQPNYETGNTIPLVITDKTVIYVTPKQNKAWHSRSTRAGALRG